MGPSRRLKLTFHEPLTSFVSNLFSTPVYIVLRINDHHIIITIQKHRKVDVYRDNKKSWNIIDSGLNVDVIRQSAMAGIVIKNLEKIVDYS